jgi:hypothetical protein
MLMITERADATCAPARSRAMPYRVSQHRAAQRFRFTGRVRNKSGFVRLLGKEGPNRAERTAFLGPSGPDHP